MTKITRTYLSGCVWCNATGYCKTNNPHPEVTTVLTTVCPVCNGSKTIVVTEEYDALYEIDCSKMNVLTPFLGRVVIEKEEDGKNKI